MRLVEEPKLAMLGQNSATKIVSLEQCSWLFSPRNFSMRKKGFIIKIYNKISMCVIKTFKLQTKKKMMFPIFIGSKRLSNFETFNTLEALV